LVRPLPVPSLPPRSGRSMDGRSLTPPLPLERCPMPPGVAAMRPPSGDAADREPPGAVRPLERGKSIDDGPSTRPAPPAPPRESPPPELVELEPAPPVEADEPDEPAEPDELEPASGRGIACAPAETGRANANAKVSVEPTMIDLAMVVPPTGGASATLLPRRLFVNSGLPGPSRAHYDRGLSSEGVVHATTVLAVRHQGKVVMASDGQVTLGNTVVKHSAKKVRRLHHDRVLAGFAGAAADGFALFQRFESKLEEHRGNLERSAVELAREWRTDRALRRLEAMLLVADGRGMYLLSGTGDLIEPDDGLMGIGSGGPFALAAARALTRHSSLDARAIVEQSMAIAADLCIYTNGHLVIEEL
jgi:ATP-dependent HslUV protease subunit HslV